MIQLTAKQIKNLQPHNLIGLLNKYGVLKTANICGVSDGTIYHRIKEYRIKKEYVFHKLTESRKCDM